MTDAILIPTQAKLERNRTKAKVAYDYVNNYLQRSIPFIVSGGVVPLLDSRYSCEAETVRKKLLELGMPSNLILMESRAKNNIENILFGLEMFSGRDLAICSYPSHIARFKQIVKVGKESGEIRSDIRIESIETDERLSERLYEIFAGILTKNAMKNGLKNARVPETFLKYLANYIMKRCSF